MLIFSAAAFADCAVLTPEEAQPFIEEDLRNVIFKILILIPTIFLSVASAWKLLKLKFGWLALALLGLGSIPFLFALLWAETWNMECGFGGIGAHYYLVLLLCSGVMLGLVKFYAEHIRGADPYP